MQKLLNLLRCFLTWVDNLFGNIWTGQSSERPKQPHREPRPLPPAPPVPAPAEKQAELKIESDEPPVYRKSKSVLTYRERILFSALRKAIENKYWIMTKVRMADFVWLSNEPKNRKFHLSKILCKHVDFLLCTRIFLIPVLVIELDDPSHQWEGRAELDKFKDDTFASIGLPILRVKMQDSYDVDELQELIHSKANSVNDVDE